LKDISFIRDINLLELLNKIDEKIVTVFKDKLNKIILYGSYARNEITSESDIDIMVLVNETEDKIREYEESITDIMVDLSLEYEVVISIYTQNVQDYEKQLKVLPFLMNIHKEGIIIR
jgi:predicted nucleotidyltransferase